MPEPVVKCGCGRTMTPDARAGRNAYRCGCGVRIKISIPEQRSVACVGNYEGDACRMTVQITDPFPLCSEHYRTSGLREYHKWINGTPDDIRHEIKELVAEAKAEAWASFRAMTLDEHGLRREEGHIIRADAEPVVYFIRSGDAVKIGTTTDLTKRIKALNLPDPVVLAAEPGYYKRERELHERFADLRINREWFRLGPALAEHVNVIRAQHGLPPVEALAPNDTHM